MSTRFHHRTGVALGLLVGAAVAWAADPPRPEAPAPRGGERPAREIGPQERPAREAAPQERPARDAAPRERPARDAAPAERPARDAAPAERPQGEPRRDGRERPQGEPRRGEAEGMTLKGVLKQLDAGKRSLVLTIQRDGEAPRDQALPLAPDLRVGLVGRDRGELADLQPGHLVVVTLTDNRRAVRVIQQVRERPVRIAEPGERREGGREVRVNLTEEPRLGVRLERPGTALADQLDLPRGQGLVLQEVYPDSTAARAGLKANDVLLEVSGQPVPGEVRDFVKLLDDVKARGALDLVLLRKGKKETVKGVKLP